MNKTLHESGEVFFYSYPYSEDMLREGIKPYASAVWNHRLNEPSTNLIPVSEQILSLILLPRTGGKFTRFGLRVNKLRYHCEGFTEKYLASDERAVVAYSPDDVSRVWLIEKGNYIEFRLIESRFEGKSLQTVEELKGLQRQILNNEAYQRVYCSDCIQYCAAV